MDAVTPPAIPGLAEQGYLTCDEALAMTDLPQRLVIIGEGATACELGKQFARRGVAVTLLQRDTSTPGGETEGMVVRSGVIIHEVTRHGRVTMVVADVEGRRVSFHGDALVVADRTTRAGR
jgi:pyruvate/2-oxoglutarate dehydrogenase complex dihydrolipoamide dehydrogenase (E3) component